jgi:hypothetical protein
VKLAPRKRRAPASTIFDADDKDTVGDHDGEEEGEDVGEMEAAAEKAADEAVGNRAETPDYAPTLSPEHVETEVESNCSLSAKRMWRGRRHWLRSPQPR